MDVILIQPKDRLSRSPQHRANRPSLPLGLLSIATPLDLSGYRVKIIDQRVDFNWEENLLNELKTENLEKFTDSAFIDQRRRDFETEIERTAGIESRAQDFA